MNDIQSVSLAEDRFERLRRIEWWDQALLSRAKVLVVGMGALGNEILKHLALVGVTHVFIADLDTIELSNLSRSVLFRDTDVGRPKVEAAAEAAQRLYPDLQIGSFYGDAIYHLGLGVFRWADVVIAGLDSREARLHVNRACYRVGRPFVDGATEVLRGVVRVFVPPEGPCYECTMSAADWTALHERRGCAGMRAERIPAGRTPTTSVTASVVAALQCQEMLKLLHGLAGLSGEGLVFDGMANDLYRIGFSRDEGCNSHDPFDQVFAMNASVHTMTARELLERARAHLGGEPQLELRHEIIDALECDRCKTVEKVMRPLESVDDRRAACPSCGVLRRPLTFRTIDARSAYVDARLDQLGVPPFDIIAARSGQITCGFELSADAKAVLGGAAELPTQAGPS